MINALKTLKIMMISWSALAVTASGMSSVVLCIGEEGHFAVEFAHDGSCGGDDRAHSHGQCTDSRTLSSADMDCCGDCIDIHLSSDAVSRPVTNLRPSISVKSTLAGLPAVPGYAEAEAGGVCLVSPRAGPLLTHSSVLARRTIVLRI